MKTVIFVIDATKLKEIHSLKGYLYGLFRKCQGV